MIENCQKQLNKIIDYCYIDLSKKQNLKEPFEKLLNFLTNEVTSPSRAALSFNNNVVSYTNERIDDYSSDSTPILGETKKKKCCCSCCRCS